MGVEFDSTQARQGHFGLQRIRQRAPFFGGQSLNDSSAGKGT
jgi:signal transduction histidine kinase